MTRLRIRSLAVMVGVVVLAACSGQNADDTEAGREQASLTVASGGVCICHAPLYVGISEGIFEKHGIEVQIRSVASGFESLGALSTGEIDVAEAVVGVAAQAVSQGADAVSILMANGDPTASVDTSEYFAIVAREEAGAAEGDIESLRGLTIGVPTKTVAHEYLNSVLLAHGMDPADVQLQNVSPPDLPSAIQSGSVDAIASWEPIPLRVLDALDGAIEVYRGGDAFEYLFQRWVSPRLIEERPDDVQAFVEAFVESMQFVRENHDRTVDILENELEGVDRAIIDQALGLLNFDPRVSASTLETAEEGLEFVREVGVLDPDSNFLLDERFRQEFVNDLEATNPEYFDDLPEIPAELSLDG